MLECLNRIVLAFNKFILWISTSWRVLNRWMWGLEFKTLLIGDWTLAFVFFPISVVMLIKVPSVISLHVRKNDRFGFPSMIIFLAVLRQSVVVVKRSLKWVLFVVLLSSFIFSNWWHLVLSLSLSHDLVKILLVLIVLSLLSECVVGPLGLLCSFGSICFWVGCVILSLTPSMISMVIRSDD